MLYISEQQKYQAMVEKNEGVLIRKNKNTTKHYRNYDKQYHWTYDYT